MKCGWFDESKAGAEIARLRARLAEVEGAARDLVYAEDALIAAKGASVPDRETSARSLRADDAACAAYVRLRAVLSRTHDGGGEPAKEKTR
jgi:hypothetical protein